MKSEKIDNYIAHKCKEMQTNTFNVGLYHIIIATTIII